MAKSKWKKKTFTIDVMEDYRPNDSMWSTEGEKSDLLKRIIFDKLTEPERRIIIMYAECGSYESVGNILHVCTTTARYQIKQIKKKIWEYYKTLS